MKLYNLTLSVPDDFDPEQLELNMNYPDEINLSGEGFVSIEDILSKCEIDVSKISESSVVIFRFPQELVDQPGGPEQLNDIKVYLESQLKCTVIGLTNNIELLVQNSAEAIQMLQGMMNKINSKAIIKLA